MPIIKQRRSPIHVNNKGVNKEFEPWQIFKSFLLISQVRKLSDIV